MTDAKIIDGWKLLVDTDSNARALNRCQLWGRYKDKKLVTCDLYVGQNTDFYKSLVASNVSGLDKVLKQGNGKKVKKTEFLTRDELIIQLFYDFITAQKTAFETKKAETKKAEKTAEKTANKRNRKTSKKKVESETA